MIAVATIPEELAWLCQRAHLTLSPDAKGIKAMDRQGNIRAMAAFDGWTENAVQFHMASDSPIAWRELLPWAFHYAFVEAGKGILFGAIAAHNKRSIRCAKHAGATETYRIKDGWARGDDLIFLELRKENCRWLALEREAA